MYSAHGGSRKRSRDGLKDDDTCPTELRLAARRELDRLDELSDADLMACHRDDRVTDHEEQDADPASGDDDDSDTE